MATVTSKETCSNCKETDRVEVTLDSNWRNFTYHWTCDVCGENNEGFDDTAYHYAEG